MTVKNNEAQLKTLFFSKALDLHTCEQKYYWRYHKWLVPKQKNPNLLRGAYVHAAMHHAIQAGRAQPSLKPDALLGIAMMEISDKYLLPEASAVEAKAMTLQLWATLHSYDVVKSELKLDINLEDGYIWKAKLDSILALGADKWQGEYKSTLRYASNLKRLYHEGIQPFTYLYVANANDLNLKGTKMFIANAKTCEVETVVATPEQLKAAQRFIYESFLKVQEIEENSSLLQGVQQFCRNRTQCITLTSECPYRALCVENASPSYVEEASNLMYDIEHPLAHYED